MIAPVIWYPGSKARIAEWIVSHFPPHVHYLEPFFGSGSILLTKSRAHVETINDIDNQVINLFSVMRGRPEEIARMVNLTPWARNEYYRSYETTGDPLEDARRFLVRCWQAQGTRTNCRSGWRNDVMGGQNTNCARIWEGVPGRIMAVAERLKGVQIECRPALDVIARLSKPQVLIYCDPPYLLGTRHGKMYKHEMTDQDHVELLEALEKHPGPVLLSGYACELYDSRLKHWERETCRALAEGGRAREEVLWINPVAARALEGNLFEGSR